MLIVGLSGVTNGGKTTLCNSLMKILPNSTKRLKQDDYFLPVDSPLHVPCSSEINHHNWELISSLDMNKMVEDIKGIVKKSSQEPVINTKQNLCSLCKEEITIDELTTKLLPTIAPTLRKCNNHRKILLIDGFIIYDDQRLKEMCDLKFFLTLPKEECFARRQNREYDPPDPPGYFDACVWPMYERHLEKVRQIPNIHIFDGTGKMDNILLCVLKKILHASKCVC
ncbi:Nicotinamide riboside kinase 2 [Armadillidium vulgare]|nr:Nicotinamide riboside kinase 2 [Armadillidium vulgare]